MSKKFKPNGKFYALVLIIFFLIVYLIAFFVFDFSNNKLENEKDVIKEDIESREEGELLPVLENKKEIYISEKEKDEYIKIDEKNWDESKYYFEEFVKIRKPSSFKPIYSGHSSDGLKFETDLNYFKVYNVEKEEYYKVPVKKKEEFKTIIDKGIYLSFDFISDSERWKSVHISYGEDVKSISGFKYDKLSKRMEYKRPVGKVQPEKSKERTKYNYTIYIDGDDFSTKIETMGPDYIRVSTGNDETYYEVSNKLYNYIKDDIFKQK